MSPRTPSECYLFKSLLGVISTNLFANYVFKMMFLEIRDFLVFKHTVYFLKLIFLSDPLNQSQVYVNIGEKLEYKLKVWLIIPSPLLQNSLWCLFWPFLHDRSLCTWIRAQCRPFMKVKAKWSVLASGSSSWADVRQEGDVMVDLGPPLLVPTVYVSVGRLWNPCREYLSCFLFCFSCIFHELFEECAV